MREGMAASAALHIILLLVIILGVPRIARELPEYRPPVPVDIVDVSELTNLSVEDSPTPADPTPPKPVAAAPKPVEQPTPKAVSAPANKPPPPPPEPTPEPVKETPPEPTPPEPVIAEKPPEPVPEKTPEPVPDAIPEKLVEAPKPAPVPVSKPKPPPPKVKVVEKPPEDEKPSTTDDFLNSVLKNVASAPDQKAERQSKVAQDAPPAPMSANNNTGKRGDRLTISEQDALRRHVSQFWSPPVGARGAETMVVVISVDMNPDRTVRTAQAVDGGRLASDPFFRAAADSAVRAVLRASPLTPLPPEKFDEWRTIKITFDPREML